MYRSVFYRVFKRGTKGPAVFRAYIEEPDDQDSHIHVFDELLVQGYECEMTPIVLDGKLFDFLFHYTLLEAQRFCETLGYEINPHYPFEAIWKRKLFRVK
jgi:hypothetical protein